MTSPKPGFALLAVTVLMIVCSGFLLFWYQNEIRFRLQANAGLRHQTIYQARSGLASQSVWYLQKFTESELREASQPIPRSALDPFFEKWSVQSDAAGDSDFLSLPMQYDAPEPLRFEALFRFQHGSVTDFPWWNLSPQATMAFKTDLEKHFPIWQTSEDQQRSAEAPLFILQREPNLPQFHSVWPGDVELEWKAGQLILGQKDSLTPPNKAWNLVNEPLWLQIRGNLKLSGNLGEELSNAIVLDVDGSVILDLPASLPEFSSSSSRWFIRAGQGVMIQGPEEEAVQVNGYLRIDQGCLKMKTVLGTIYWKGSIACSVEAPKKVDLPLHLSYSRPLDAIPPMFQYTALLPNGIQLTPQ